MDARRQRSQDRLYAAVLALAADRPPEDISMTALAEAAGVHRSTIYDHADSSAALLEQALSAELDVWRDTMVERISGDPAEAIAEGTRGVVSHLARHAAIYRRGLGDDSGRASLHGMLSRHFRTSSHQLVEAASVEVDAPIGSTEDALLTDMALRFITDGTIGAMASWVQSPDPDIEAFMRIYPRLLPSWWPGDLTDR